MLSLYRGIRQRVGSKKATGMAAAVVTTTVLPPRATAVATTLQRGLRL
jgi:hypothetical protein